MQLLAVAPSTSFCHPIILGMVLLILPFLLLPVLQLPSIALSQNVTTTLPGYPGNLPFYLETGYIGVGELDAVQLFYYFVESGNPKDDPLVLWLTGGPGCSALSGLIYEIGPFTFNYTNSNLASRPTLELNPYSWTKVANIIFLDAPVGTGFSYANTAEAYIVNDTLSGAQTYEFLRKWLVLHPKFQNNPFYVAGDSYSGVTVPMLSLKISDGIEAGLTPLINLQGYILGNPLTTLHDDLNSRIPFAHSKALIPDELFQALRIDCNGEYVNVDKNNSACVDDLKVETGCIQWINSAQILEPYCDLNSPKPKDLTKWDRGLVSEDDNPRLLLKGVQALHRWCRVYNYLLSYIWANDKLVQDALNIRQGTIKEWLRCNKSLAYTEDVYSSLSYHIELIRRGYRMLIYSGDHDMIIPYLGTLDWIEALNMTLAYEWQPWFVDGQAAGYTIQFYDKKSRLTYATVKGAGHTAPEYKPEECYAMFERWIAHFPLEMDYPLESKRSVFTI